MMYPYVAITPDCHPYDFVRPSRHGRIDGSDWALLLISTIVTCLGRESVVCVDNYTRWLHRLYVLVLFCYCMLFVVFKE